MIGERIWHDGRCLTVAHLGKKSVQNEQQITSPFEDEVGGRKAGKKVGKLGVGQPRVGRRGLGHAWGSWVAGWMRRPGFAVGTRFVRADLLTRDN